MGRLAALLESQSHRDLKAPVVLSPASTTNYPVQTSRDLTRILALDTREPGTLDNHPDLASIYRPGGFMTLWPIQQRALSEAAYMRGLLAPIGVGGGKTLVAALLPTVLDTPNALILTTPAMVRESGALIAEYRKHFHVRDDLRIMSYGMLSRPEQTDWLERNTPGLIVADECQALAHRDSARTARFLRYMSSHPNTLFCGMSASLTRRSLLDYGHLAKLALGVHSPLPLDWPVLVQWAEALDVGGVRPPGALSALGGATAREGYRSRLISSPGVVSSVDAAFDKTVTIVTLDKNYPSVSPVIREALTTLEREWMDPSGEWLVQATEVASTRRAIRMGGYYRWIWPANTDLSVATQWEATRSSWASALRYFLKHRKRAGLDSPALVTASVEAGTDKHTRHLRDLWDALQRARAATPGPDTVWEWLCPSVAQFGADQLLREHVEIVWTTHPELGREIAQRADVPYFGAGDSHISEHRGPCVASVQAHGTGRNLQHYSAALVLGSPSGGSAWEQLIGRHARPGQANHVTFCTLHRSQDELVSAYNDAQYVAQTTGQAQFLLTCKRRQHKHG